MGLRDIGATLPPGFRFYPSDEELVCHYLHKKILNEESLKGTTLVDIDLHTCEPWQLPQVAKLNSSEWYFFNFRDRKYATGFRTNRATTSGYWKATGKDRIILDPSTKEIVGMRKTLVFYRNRAPNGTKTGWIMHEFRLESPHMPPKEDWVLCRVFHKGKENDNNNQLSSCQSMFNNHTIPLVTSPISSISNDYHHTISSAGHHLPNSISSNTNNHLSFSQNDNNIMDIINPSYDGPTTNPNSILSVNHGSFLQLVKGDDDYGLLLDNYLEGTNKLMGGEGFPQIAQNGGGFEDDSTNTFFI